MSFQQVKSQFNLRCMSLSSISQVFCISLFLIIFFPCHVDCSTGLIEMLLYLVSFSLDVVQLLHKFLHEPNLVNFLNVSDLLFDWLNLYISFFFSIWLLCSWTFLNLDELDLEWLEFLFFGWLVCRDCSIILFGFICITVRLSTILIW